MTKTTALSLLRQYADVAKSHKSRSHNVQRRAIMSAVTNMSDQTTDDESTESVAISLGFVQGAMVASGVFNSDAIARHMVTGRIPPECTFCRGHHGPEVTHVRG